MIPRAWFFAVFAVSGFAGLIYESIWSHYLKLFLGHAAYAQTLVLAVLMGGMALGAWGSARLAHRWRRLLVGYAVAEAAIGLCALAFHRTFVAATGLAYDSLLPALEAPAAALALRWALSTALILPQSVLLGATFPLMSAGVMRAFPDRPGATLAMLYFTNSLGAALGVLASGFLLVDAVGLPGTVLTAGLLNIALATAVWLMARRLPPQAAPAADARPAPARAAPAGEAWLLGVALLTGAASFLYEIGWIRMLSMVLGASTHAFELMLSAFLLGLAFGGLWIRRRIDGVAMPETFLGAVQVAMGLCALATLLLYNSSFELMQALLATVARTPNGYAAFNAGSHLIALLVMFPAAFCAGMTLPLLTHSLLSRGAGERAIGAVYAANTVGAIAGAVLATHAAMPVLGLKGLITLGAGLDIALGVALLWRFAENVRPARVAAALGVAAVGGTLAWVQLDALKMASGVYRDGRLMQGAQAQVPFHRDGKTATVNLVRAGDRVSITTNGKSDAMMSMAPGAGVGDDEPVMVLLGGLPLLLHPQARSAAVIGFGSGITTHTLLASDTLRVVDTVEIEPAMVEGARGFLPRNAAAYEDPRSRVHIDDAKAFFAAQGRRYDLIVSEPSNPWVSGVASLFSDEFYRRARGHLEPRGLFVQWLQLYEIDPALVASVMRALARNFPDYEVYAPDDNNAIIVARDGAAVPRPVDAALREPRLAAALARLGIRGAADAEVFRVGSRRTLQPYFDGFAIAANSDYFPVLDQNAARARFMGARANGFLGFAALPVPVLEILGDAPRPAVAVPARAWSTRSTAVHFAQEELAYLLGGDERRLAQLTSATRTEARLLRQSLAGCAPGRGTVAVEQLASPAARLLAQLARGESATLWRQLAASPCLGGGPRAAWIALFAAIDARDAAAMAAAAGPLLAASDFAAGSHADFLLAAAVTGRLARGEREAAAALWRTFSPRVTSERSDMTPEYLQSRLFPAGGG